VIRDGRHGTPAQGPGFGCPLGGRVGVNPTPMPEPLDARAYAARLMRRHDAVGSRVQLTRPLELVSARRTSIRTGWSPRFARWRRVAAGCPARLLVRADLPQARSPPQQLCAGVISTPRPGLARGLRPVAAQALAFKANRRLWPTNPLWRDFAYDTKVGNRPSTLSTAARAVGMGHDPAATGPAPRTR